MKKIHVFNPVSGSGHSPSILSDGPAANDELHVTTGVGDAESFIYNKCLAEPDTHFVVYGGDGTLNEAANGILRAGAGERAALSVIPAGTGNDFVRTLCDKGKSVIIDAMKYNGRFAVNIVNFGFDSNVVAKTAAYKKVIPGSPAYIMGVADNLCRKLGERWNITVENPDGSIERFSDEYILALVGNCRYYGGGFCSAPLANPCDGLLDFVAVSKVTKFKFLSLVGEYKKGLHLSAATGEVAEKFKKYISFRRVKKIIIDGVRNICADGEIEDASSVEISVVPNALRIIT